MSSARMACEALLDSDPHDADALYVAALAEVHAGELLRACRMLQTAIDADASFALARYALACALRSRGEDEAARDEWERLRTQLTALPADAVLRGPDPVTADWLASIVASEEVPA